MQRYTHIFTIGGGGQDHLQVHSSKEYSSAEEAYYDSEEDVKAALRKIAEEFESEEDAIREEVEEQFEELDHVISFPFSEDTF